MRWWMPVAFLLLAIGAAAFLWLSEAPFIEPSLMGVGLSLCLLLGLWYIFFTGLRGRTRLFLLMGAMAFLATLYVGVAKLTRVEGSIGGSGIPRLVWKWTPKPQGSGRELSGGANDVLSESTATNGIERADFPQFLGPNRTGMITNAPLARDWVQSPPKCLWRQPIGLGWSGFSVSGRQAITQEQRGEDEMIVSYELQSGNVLWAHTNRVRFSEMLGGDGPRATPTISHGRVYAMGGSGILDCLEKSTGRLIWSRDVLGENHLTSITWGKSCSPLLVGEVVLVTGGEEREKTLLAYEAASGNPAWNAGRDRASYSSPMLVSLAGREQIVLVNGRSVTGHELPSGKILWEYPWPAEYAKVTQPLLIDTNHLFIAAGYGVGCVMLQIDASPTGEWTATPLWKNRNIKPKFTNLVKKGEHVYGLDDGVLVCVDLRNGERAWKQGRYGHGQILLVNDLLLVQAENGEVVMLDINPTAPQELTRFKALKGKTWNNPVLVHDLLLVRNDQEAACYQVPLAESAQGDEAFRAGPEKF